MITVKGILLFIVLCLVVPYLLGTIWTKKLSHVYEQNSVALALVMGMLTMFACFQVPAVFMIIKRYPFHLLITVFVCEMTVLCVFSVIYNACRYLEIWKRKIEELRLMWKESVLVKVLIITFLCMVIGQAVLLSYADLYDTDDARYLAEGLDAIETDQMLLTHPLTGESLTSPIGEMVKDVVSPWSMFLASLSAITGIHIATLSHVLLPLVLIPVCYLIYWLLSVKIFSFAQREKRFLFMNFLCMLVMFGRLSPFWDSAYLLYRIWQGKAILAAIIIPFLFWLMNAIMEDYEHTANYILLFITMLALCVLTPISFIFPPVIVGVYGLLIAFYKKKPIIVLKVFLTCLPVLCYLLVSELIGMEKYAV
ncbi:MAG: hypothetical protein GX567_07505 [Clostridia bacterium]|nr:hypothetical protein [Clostridia bacterium]